MPPCPLPFCAPIWVLSGVSAGSAFGVSCARNACFIDRCTAAEDLSFWTRRMAYCMSREYPLRAPSRKHDVDSLHFPSESREPLRGPGSPTPKHVRLSAHELNTGTGAFAPPRRPFGVPAWITRTAAYRPPFRVTHPSTCLRQALPHGLIDLFPPIACPLLTGQQ